MPFPPLEIFRNVLDKCVRNYVMARTKLCRFFPLLIPCLEKSTTCVLFRPIVQRIICLMNLSLPLWASLIPYIYGTETGVEFFIFAVTLCVQ